MRWNMNTFMSGHLRPRLRSCEGDTASPSPTRPVSSSARATPPRRDGTSPGMLAGAARVLHRPTQARPNAPCADKEANVLLNVAHVPTDEQITDALGEVIVDLPARRSWKRQIGELRLMA